jgi:hypothetical protein
VTYIRTRSKSALTLVAALALLAGACGRGGSATPTAQATDEGARAGTVAKGTDQAGSKKAAKGKTAPGQQGDAGSVSGGGGAEENDGLTGGGAAAIDPRLRTASSVIEEPQPDATKGGVPESYPEVLRVAIEGLGDDFRITFTFAGDVPQEMPDDKTFMVVGLGLKDRADKRSYAFGAQGTKDGWKAYAGGKGEANGGQAFPGTFFVEGNEILMTIPWSYMKGPYPFRWQASSSWFRSVASTSHYSFDPIPNKKMARFPN